MVLDRRAVATIMDKEPFDQKNFPNQQPVVTLTFSVEAILRERNKHTRHHRNGKQGECFANEPRLQRNASQW